MILQVVFWMSLGFVALAYVGYPLGVWVLAGVMGKPVRKGPVSGTVSFIVAAHNEASHIETRIRNLLEQEGVEVAQVIVGSDGSTDGTDDIVSNMNDPRVQLIALAKRSGKPAVLNACVRRATGDYLVFCDARQTFAPEAAARLVVNFAEVSVKCVSGELVIGARPDGRVDAGLYWRYEKFIRRNESKLYSTVGATGAIYAIRRQDFVELPEDALLDDVTVPLRAQRAGGRTVFEPEALAHDEPVSSEREWSRKVRTLAGNFQLLFAPGRYGNPFRRATCLQFLGHKVARLLVPLAMVTTLIGTFGFSGPSFWTLVSLQGIGYVGAGGGWLLERSGRSPGLLGLPLTFVMLNLAVAAGFWGWLRGSQGVLWARDPKQETP